MERVIDIFLREGVIEEYVPADIFELKNSLDEDLLVYRISKSLNTSEYSKECTSLRKLFSKSLVYDIEELEEIITDYKFYKYNKYTKYDLTTKQNIEKFYNFHHLKYILNKYYAPITETTKPSEIYVILFCFQGKCGCNLKLYTELEDMDTWDLINDNPFFSDPNEDACGRFFGFCICDVNSSYI